MNLVAIIEDSLDVYPFFNIFCISIITTKFIREFKQKEY